MISKKYSLDKNKKPLDIYSGVDLIPTGHASCKITEGCLVLEGGAWRGLYTSGVLDALMLQDINFRTTVGISAGAMFGLGYVSGQIGWTSRIDLIYRHDPNYCGIGAYRRDHGITGFHYLFNEILKKFPLDRSSLMNPERRFLVGATDIESGKINYFEKGRCKILKAIQASATVPFISRPVLINGRQYLDGGCSVKIPYEWAKDNGEKKIIVVKTREMEFRRKEKTPYMAKAVYHKYPALIDSMRKVSRDYNLMCDELEERSRKKEIFVIAPSQKVEVSHFEGDMEKLGELYWLGYHDMLSRIDELRDYLNIRYYSRPIYNQVLAHRACMNETGSDCR